MANSNQANRSETEVKLARPIRVKNKISGPIHTTGEPKQKITGDEKRKEFENLIRRSWQNKSVWVKYAKWEESQNDLTRARSVWERALDIDIMDHTLWSEYADFEMRNKLVDHARNVLDRATQLLHWVDQLWYKYIHMEEVILGNVAGARQIFERWTRRWPDQQGWLSYIEFELRYNEVERARAVFEGFVVCHPRASAWIRYAEFEMKNGEIARARNCYERGSGMLADEEEEAPEMYVAFAEFEEMCCKETERARCIYKYALDRIIPKGTDAREIIYNKFVAQYGRNGDDDALALGWWYEDVVRIFPLNYDVWLEYIKLLEEEEEESGGNINRARIEDVYERATANVPPSQEKRHWWQYIHLWINYALYEELQAQDMDRTRDVYSSCLKTIPHNKFSFAKIWVMAAQFEIRQLNMDRAREILDSAIGTAPKNKIFKKYIEIELKLGNLGRCRKLYDKYLEWKPDNCYAWTKLAEFERSLGETERARAIFELAINQPALDIPELLWMAYIDFEISESEYERTRALYERLLNLTKHFKVWMSYSKFEAYSAMKEAEGTETSNYLEHKRKCIERARAVFERALSYFRTYAPDCKEEMTMLLDEWLNMESSSGELGDVDLVRRAKLPKKLNKITRNIDIEDDGYEEYIDYLFPEETQPTNLKILEAADRWKKLKSSDH